MGQGQGQMRVLLGDQQRGPGLVDGPQDLEDVTDHQRRQPQGGLVEQQQARPGHQGPPNGQHLLLPARKGAGELPPALPEDRDCLLYTSDAADE